MSRFCKVFMNQRLSHILCLGTNSQLVIEQYSIQHRIITLSHLLDLSSTLHSAPHHPYISSPTPPLKSHLQFRRRIWLATGATLYNCPSDLHSPRKHCYLSSIPYPVGGLVP